MTLRAIVPLNRRPLVVPKVANGYVVVTFWQEKGGRGPGSYEYEHRPALSDAIDTYREYQDGEYARATAVGIFEARNGLPIGQALSPARLLQLLHETRNVA